MSVDWAAVRAEYEQGASLRDIVTQHGSSIATISRVARHDGWIRSVSPLETRPVKHETPISPKPPPPVSMPMDAVSIARTGLRQLAQHLQADDILPIASHKSLSDALAQYVKVLITAPQEQETREGLLIPLDGISDYTRREIRRLLLEDAEQQREVS
jgi:hypothetical protein